MGVFDHKRSDGCFRICPYCDEKYQVEAEDYSPESRVEECDSCGKKYLLWDEFDVTHYAHRDCQSNGEKHEPDDEIPTYCNKCGMHICDDEGSA